MGDQPFETGPAAIENRSIGGHGPDAFAKAAHRRQESSSHRSGHGVERLEGAVDGVWPSAQVSRFGLRTLVSGRVFAVVAREVEILQVDERVPPVDLGHGEGGIRSGLCCGQVCLVMSIRLGRAASEQREEGLDSGRREVLDLAIELVQAGGLAGLGHVQLPDRTKPVGDHGVRT